MDPYDRFNSHESEEEYRRRQAAKAKRRKKRRMQRILLIAAFALAAVLLVVCIVAIFKAIFGGDKDSKSKPKNSSSSTSVSASVELPTTGPGIDYPVAPDPSLWSLILVNSQRALASDYSYDTAVVTDVGHKVDARIADSLKQMVADCNAVEGNSLSIASGARSPQTQNDKYNFLVNYYKSEGHDEGQADALARQTDPPAGYSEHETGLAVDFITGTLNEPSQAFAETAEYAWLTEHAADYGFILRYPSEKESITGILVQPYHWRYVGAEDAKTIKGAGICLEEYLVALPGSDDANGGDAGAGGGDGGGDSGSDSNAE